MFYFPIFLYISCFQWWIIIFNLEIAGILLVENLKVKHTVYSSVNVCSA